MARDEAYWEAERRIEKVQRDGAATLNLSGMNLTEVPEAIASLTQLKTLDLSYNKLTSVPVEITFLPQLIALDLSRGQLTSVPIEIASLARLKTLYLSDNQLTSIPAEIASLTQLTTLNLSYNKLTSVPVGIASLTQLTGFDLSGNELTSMPEGIASLTQLKILNLSDNQLTSLPDGIASLTQLTTLNLDNNPLEPELAAAHEQGIEAVFRFLRAKANDSIVLNEAKLILIGEGEVGKTSLLGALRGDTWVENRTTTHGVEVDTKSLVVIDSDSDKEITFNAWDFGGQNIYRHTHQMFFTSPAIYLAVWNPRRGPEQCRVDEWLKMVKHRAFDEKRPDEKPHILVVATHGGPKERLDHIDEQALREEFGNLIVDFYHIDSKTEFGLAELKRAICSTAATIPQVGRSVPTSWKQVLDAVRQRSETDAWITYEQFQILCAEQSVDLALAKTYVAILNELGHLIHYSTDPVLKDTVILKPEWLSKAISFVLEDKQVKDQNGLFRHDLLSELWDDPARNSDRYPQHLHPVFLKLMEKFDLSYQVELSEAGATPTSLMAQLVPSNRPDGWEKDWILKPDDTERTQICRLLDKETGRTVELEGLIYRLIVRLHRYSLGRDNYYKSRHWKNGLLLDDVFNGRAFIEEIAGDVYITVRAAYPSGFLGHLCAEVQSLVKSFWHGVDPRLHLPCPTEGCKGLLERDEIIDYKARGSREVRCAVCRKFHDINRLMASTAAKPEWQEAVTQLNLGQQEILKAVSTNYDALSLQLRALMSQADEQYRALLTTLADPAKDGPRLFSFEPVDPSFWDKPKWVAQKFRLTLWCEHSRLPLTVLNDDDTSGVYEIDLTRDWIKRASPILRILSVTLKLALPIAIPGTKLATDDKAYSAISEQLEFGVKSADSFQQGSVKLGDWLVNSDSTEFDLAAERTRSIIRAQGSVLRELHALLKAQDPAHSFGGLERVQNKRREFLWVHPQFVGEY
jgi:C-terminal of Roc, COR, domain/Ras of Complex, Roc, domain of DAPkinase/Leucine rich repeat/Leucine Rich repeats (2 copies)